MEDLQSKIIREGRSKDITLEEGRIVQDMEER